MAIVPTLNGSIDAYATNPTDLVLDIFSYFAPITLAGHHHHLAAFGHLELSATT